MQLTYLHFKHPNVLRALDELLRSNYFLGSITPKTPEIDFRNEFNTESSSEVLKATTSGPHQFSLHC